ncbi:MAG: efflux RND transporter permease subunit [Candidatus Manganitrophus sp.]|nr:MAG: efflux RND transporter permease subunit [Candidatus Manganitrophus sp.]
MTIGRTLETLLGGREVTRFKREGEQYDVIVQLADEDRTNPRDLSSIYVRGAEGELVQLANLVQMNETVAPKELNHFNRFRAAIITANIAPGYALGDALEVSRTGGGGEVACRRRARADLDGQSREFKESGAALYPDLRARAGLHLPRARRTVRELHRSVRHPAHRAAGDDRRAITCRSGSPAARSTSTARSGWSC